MLLHLPVTLLPIQILLVNLFTDGLPAIALGMEPPARDIMTVSYTHLDVYKRQCMRCARSIGKAARRGSCSAICRLFRWTALCLSLIHI